MILLCSIIMECLLCYVCIQLYTYLPILCMHRTIRSGSQAVILRGCSMTRRHGSSSISRVIRCAPIPTASILPMLTYWLLSLSLRYGKPLRHQIVAPHAIPRVPIAKYQCPYRVPSPFPHPPSVGLAAFADERHIPIHDRLDIRSADRVLTVDAVGFRESEAIKGTINQP